ncbi:AAA family ATPase [Anaerolineae bacterium CFX7]|nr:AAA family ATPase [Anaerolineae bacterium CFX7]RIK34290.1 MAG: AAA family ATPase [Chloroflexota bacterium]
MANVLPLAILLTGAPGVGKSTVIQRVIENLPERPGGFFTREVRRNGERVGFEIVTLDGETAMLAMTDAHTVIAREKRLGQYRVNLEVIDSVAVPALHRAQARSALVIVDEIGPMEIFSNAFCDAVQQLLDDTHCAVLGTIVARPYHFANDVKKHPRVELVRVTRENRDELVQVLDARLRE